MTVKRGLPSLCPRFPAGMPVKPQRMTPCRAPRKVSGGFLPTRRTSAVVSTGGEGGGQGGSHLTGPESHTECSGLFPPALQTQAGSQNTEGPPWGCRVLFSGPQPSPLLPSDRPALSLGLRCQLVLRYLIWLCCVIFVTTLLPAGARDTQTQQHLPRRALDETEGKDLVGRPEEVWDVVLSPWW